MRAVLDTNVWIAAALSGGFSESIIQLAVEHRAVDIVCSEEILAEVAGKLRSKFKWEEARIENFSDKIRKIAKIVVIAENLSVIKRDPDDNKILECAVAGEANLIVSADQDLIELKKFRGIAIIHPKTLSWTFPQYFKKEQMINTFAAI